MRRSPDSVATIVLLALSALALLSSGVAIGHGINHLGADPQASVDGVVRMESVFATEDGFVVVYRDRNGSRGEVLAHRPFSASTRDVYDVPVEIGSEAWADLPPNATLRAVLHGDDGDGEFEPASDPPLASFGGVAGESFVVRRGTTAYVGAASGAGVQRSADGTVVVRSVRLPERGYVVLRNSSGGSPGEIVGTAALSAGHHTNVSVDLDGSFFAERPVDETFSVWVQAYGDDGDGEFGDGDRPIRAGEEAVGTRFGVEKVPAGATATPTPEEGSIVRTSTPTALPTTPTATRTSAPPSVTDSPSTSETSRTAGDGVGFDAVTGLVAFVALVAGALARRR